MHSLGLRILASASLTATLAISASCAQMIEVGPRTSAHEGADASVDGTVSPDAGFHTPDAGVVAPTGRWVLVALSTGECDFQFVGVDEVVPGAPPVGSCHPCPTPVDGPADHDGATCELANYPRCIYTSTTTQYLDCKSRADGSLTFEWSTSP